MSTLPVRAPLVASVWPPQVALARIISGAEALLDMMAEANRLAAAARARFPFAD